MKFQTCLRGGLLALLCLLILPAAGMAAGDLFDNEYTDCPAATRLRGGEIGNLTISRSDTDAKTAVLHWDTTDPAGWGLGGNAYTTSLVALMDDGKTKSQSLSLSARKATFDDLATGAKLKAQLAIVTEVSGDKYLISDIIEARLGGTIEAPGFSSPWMKVAGLGAATAGTNYRYGPTDLDASVGAKRVDEDSDHGFYYIGYGEAFGNYRAGAGMGFDTKPASSKLRIGLRHADAGALDEVDFKAYIIRIVDSDGDVIVDDTRTRAANYGKPTVCTGTDCVANGAGRKQAQPLFFFYDVAGDTDGNHPTVQHGGSNDTFKATRSSVRVVDGAEADPAIAVNDTGGGEAKPDTLSNWAPGWRSGNAYAGVNDAGTENTVSQVTHGTVFAPLPHHYRDFPASTMVTDETYTVSAWAVNGLGETISPRALIKVRPKDSTADINVTDTYASTAAFSDYLNASTRSPNNTPPDDNTSCTPAAGCKLIVTEFTVIIPQD